MRLGERRPQVGQGVRFLAGLPEGQHCGRLSHPGQVAVRRHVALLRHGNVGEGPVPDPPSHPRPSVLLEGSRERQGRVRDGVVRAPDGRRVTLACGARAVSGPDGNLVVLVNVSDVSERRATEQRHAHDAAHDPLTGLPNRRHLDTMVAQHQQSARTRPGGALLLIDLDHFRRVNDTSGHAAGDVLLTEIAEVLHRTVGGHGTVGRRGGEEFQVLLPEATLPSAETLTMYLEWVHTARYPWWWGPITKGLEQVEKMLIFDNSFTQRSNLPPVTKALYQANISTAINWVREQRAAQAARAGGTPVAF